MESKILQEINNKCHIAVDSLFTSVEEATKKVGYGRIKLGGISLHVREIDGKPDVYSRMVGKIVFEGNG